MASGTLEATMSEEEISKARESRAEYTITLGVPIMEYYTVEDLKRMLHVSRDRISRWQEREEDPLPVFYLPDRFRGGVIQRDDLYRWLIRNCKTKSGVIVSDLLP